MGQGRGHGARAAILHERQALRYGWRTTLVNGIELTNDEPEGLSEDRRLPTAVRSIGTRVLLTFL